MKFKTKLIKPLRLLHFAFSDQIDLTLSFLRIQEYYESPKFRSRFFTLEDYIYWYCSRKKVPEPFDYLVDIAGFNIPGNWFRKFETEFGHGRLTQREFAIIDEVNARFGEESEDFYLIGTTSDVSNLEGYLAHEVRHAMFYLIPEYRRDILRVIRKFPTKNFRKKLLDGDTGYNKSVINDEVHAYTLTGLDPYYECKIGELPTELQSLRKDLKKVERQYIKRGVIHV